MISPDVTRAYALDREGGERLDASSTSAAGLRELKARTRDEGAAATLGLFQDR